MDERKMITPLEVEIANQTSERPLRGFTLIELLVVIAIIAVLMAILSPSSWIVWYDQERWWDQITVRHGDGSNLSFADGHSDYWKWKEPSTLTICKADYDYWQGTGRHGDMSRYPGSQDLHNVQKAVWGELGYTPVEQ